MRHALPWMIHSLLKVVYYVRLIVTFSERMIVVKILANVVAFSKRQQHKSSRTTN